MPFGIASGPEECQRRQHEFLDGLNGVTNIADYICVYGCGDTKEEADIDHDRNLTHEIMTEIFDSPREKFNSSPALFHLWGTDLPAKEFSLIQVK